MDEHCPHHTQCRSDHDLPAAMLCGYHHHRVWSHCQRYRDYQADARFAKAAAKADVTATGGNEAISEAIREEADAKDHLAVQA